MKIVTPLVAALLVAGATVSFAQTNNQNNPTWWEKYQYLVKNGQSPEGGGSTTSLNVGGNVDVSNECGPQSEVYITLNASRAKNLAAGSNEIYRDPMRGYFSFDGGATWGGVDIPL
ncbi:MAG TPA: hypothetical protein VHL58_07190, partial [Thermoanaerobaculia bacterium]|nr:hypothetical protein [Thermoanaerobaculia bacterium]